MIGARARCPYAPASLHTRGGLVRIGDMEGDKMSSTIVCTLDIEVRPMDWKPLRGFDSYEKAIEVQKTLALHGVDSTISCPCGAYEYGACELCAGGTR